MKAKSIAGKRVAVTSSSTERIARVNVTRLLTLRGEGGLCSVSEKAIALGPAKSTLHVPRSACTEAWFAVAWIRLLEGRTMRREWRIVIAVAIICLGLGFILGRTTASGSRVSDVSVDSKTYSTCMALWRDVADCAEVMKRLNAWAH